jgi:hypothetical protein
VAATPAPAQPARPRRKSPALAVALQCIPLLAAGACILNGATDQEGSALACLLWWSALFWGFGYVYLFPLARRRMLVTLVAGPLLAFGGCTAIFSGVSYDFEHPYNAREADKADADRASVQTGLLLAAAVLLLAVDAWRLAALTPEEH